MTTRRTTPLPKCDRPNAVAGLIDKRRQVASELKAAKTKVNALDRAIRMFAPTVDDRLLIAIHAAVKGELQRLTMDTMRASGEPVTTLQIAELFCRRRGLEADEATFKLIRYRVTKMFATMRRRGQIQEAGMDGWCKGWELA